MTLVLDGTNNTYLSATERGQLMTLSTAQVTTSGTSIDFTSIPSWAKKITVMFNGVSTNGISNPLIQIGSGSVITTGYSAVSTGADSTVATSTYTTGFGIRAASATNSIFGNLLLTSLGSNIWVCNGVVSSTSGTTFFSSGGLTLGGSLDRVRLTTVAGTDTFDAGSVNILIEGSL